MLAQINAYLVRPNNSISFTAYRNHWGGLLHLGGGYVWTEYFVSS
jgi:hypothetical protein